MSHRKLVIDGFDTDADTLSQQLHHLSTTTATEQLHQVEQKASQVRAFITRGNTNEALNKALSDPPYGHGMEGAQAANAQLVSEILMSTRAQDINQVVAALGEEARDVLLKYIYHGLKRPAEFNCGVLLSWHEKVVEAGGLGSIVRVLSDRKTV
ncbi:actin related protein 2/3 complex subunit 5 [Kickxella alabastrina]|uniref:actin related protein 2/3 complex subunit 5 n=1 Tax=Kickxella alabastrina TaxID=61397 RepID=UPI002220AEA9|nr:actin related protein 2/3 complex subunit 5 [Kickxella alabastrina]KAI7825927.1 actin related protein 2/3 complex subunit 5 [Kickxella alabastrina]KAJ1947183.1 arp2/3 complex subunit [Kickxella alabastrina]